MTASIEIHKQSHLHFVTGRLAQQAVHEIVSALANRYGFDYSIGVMPITVAALMTPAWLKRKLSPTSTHAIPDGATHLIVPGYCDVDIETLQQSFSGIVVLGPRDCRDLGELFGERKQKPALDRHSIEIIAEINHAPRLSLETVVDQAQSWSQQGADRIDIGCDPAYENTQQRFERIAEYVSALVEKGIAVSVDSFDPWEVSTAVDAGATLVLSVNSTNRHLAADWGCEVVVIPDRPTDLSSLDQTVDYLSQRNVPMRLDPILEPIGAGLAASLVRYASVRERYPELPMMMGIGNLTELTDVDTAGVNVILLGICQELKIRSVLTTEVISWAQSSVRECDHARRLVFEAVEQGIPPKNMSDQLVMLRDRKCDSLSPTAIAALAESIKDNNYRLFASEGEVHLASRQLHLHGRDPFRVFDDLISQPISDNVDAGHAFYLGFEMAKASIAMTLGKRYEQDRALDWGLLTVQEDQHRIARTSRHRQS